MDKLSNHVDGDLNKATDPNEHTLPQLSLVCLCLFWLHRQNAHASKRPRTPDPNMLMANIVYIIFISLTHVMAGEWASARYNWT